MTFRELYRKELDKPAPAKSWIAEIARITKKSEITVRRWLGDDNLKSSCRPDPLTRDVLAKHFNTTPEALFPESN
ncbi:MAG: hypothetical protein K2K81_07200 [Muribaculaceae bacterium]|nr:hypothetical protein [Muribaculaceae bacterium]